jgi:5'-3' exonuclease
VWALKGFEFDDICAWAAMHYRNRYTRIVAMTNDTDLYQLFDIPCFSIFKSAKQGVYTREHFIEEWGDLTRDQWVMMLALQGTHNGVPGIHGIGPKTALKIITKDHERRSILLRSEHGDLIERNQQLIRLPMRQFPRSPGFRLGSHRHVDLRSFARFVGRFDIQTTSGMLEALQDLRNNGH